MLALAAAAALSGCVAYGPPYATYYEPAPVASSYYYPYSSARPAYVGPPVTLDFGFYHHSYSGGHHGWRGHGWGGGHGWRGGHGGHHGGWRGRR